MLPSILTAEISTGYDLASKMAALREKEDEILENLLLTKGGLNGLKTAS